MSSTINFHDLSKLSTTARQNLCKRTEADLSDFEAKVKPIMRAVADEGDVALARFAREFDKAPVEPSDIAATKADFDAAEKSLMPDVREALEFAAQNIRKFHEDQKPEEMWLHKISPGSFAGDTQLQFHQSPATCHVAKAHFRLRPLCSPSLPALQVSKMSSS